MIREQQIEVPLLLIEDSIGPTLDSYSLTSNNTAIDTSYANDNHNISMTVRASDNEDLIEILPSEDPKRYETEIQMDYRIGNTTPPRYPSAES